MSLRISVKISGLEGGKQNGDNKISHVLLHAHHEDVLDGLRC